VRIKLVATRVMLIALVFSCVYYRCCVTVSRAQNIGDMPMFIFLLLGNGLVYFLGASIVWF
jgi:hypothetical protein